MTEQHKTYSKRPEKKFYAEHYSNSLKEAEALVVFNYGNLSANDANELRRSLQKQGASYRVIGKRVLKHAMKGADLELNDVEFKGSVGVLESTENSIDVIKSLYDFSKEKGGKKGLFKVQAGVYEGEVLDADKVKALSELPSKEQMQSMLLGVLAAPMSGVVGAMNSVVASVPTLLMKKAEKSE